MRGQWKTVTSSRIVTTRGSVLGADTSRRIRMWQLDLECGHTAERLCRYAKRPATDPRANGWHPRPSVDVLPPPRHVRCEQHTEDRRGVAPSMGSVPLENRRVPRPRGDLDAAAIRRIRRLQARVDEAQDELEQAVVDAHRAGASLRAIHEAFGYAQTTVLRWIAARDR